MQGKKCRRVTEEREGGGKERGKQKTPDSEREAKNIVKQFQARPLHLAVAFPMRSPVSPLKDLHTAVHPTGKKIILGTNVNTP